MLERAFGGVSSEVLWKPAEQNWGVGAELNWVAQRDTYSWFGFGEYDYDVVMGHASLYWDTGWYGLEAQLDAGRYLAGDWGATLSVQRIFSNGWAIGAYVTRTDVSEDDFGEGSYDKGILRDDPAALGDAVRDPADDLGRRAVARRATAARSSTSPTGSIRRSGDCRSRGSRRSWGAFWE